MSHAQSVIAKIPERIEWGVLITMIQSTYKYGSGGIVAETGVDHSALYKAKRLGPTPSAHILLWNLAVEKIENGLLTEDQVRRCILPDAGVGDYV